MQGPEDLFDTVKNDAISRLFARMICSEAAMVGRMPILRRQDELKVSLQFVGDGNDFITVRYGQRAAGQKIILKINDDQRFHWMSVHNVTLSEAKNLGSFLADPTNEIDQRCFAPLNMTAPFMR
jgi:hypothetical protein